MVKNTLNSFADDKMMCMVAGTVQLFASVGAIAIIGPEAIGAVHRELVLQNGGKLAAVGKTIAIVLILLLLNAVVVALASSAMMYASKRRARLLRAIWPFMFVVPLLLIFVVLMYALLSVPAPVLMLAWICMVFISFRGAKAYRRICRASSHLV